MSVPTLNAVVPGPTPAGGASNATTVGGAASSAASGFEALLGVFFGSQHGLAAELLAGATPGAKADGETAEGGDDPTTGLSAEAQGLAAGFLAVPLLIPNPPQPTGSADATPDGAATAISCANPDGSPPPVPDQLAEALEPGVAATKPETGAASANASAAGALASALKSQNAAPAAADAPGHTKPSPAADATEAGPPRAAPPKGDAATALAATAEATAAKPPTPSHAQPAAAAPGVDAGHGAAVSAVAASGSGSSANGGADLSKGKDAAPPDVSRVEAKAAHDESQGQPAAPPAASPTSAAPLTHAATQVRGAPETVAHLAAQMAKHLDGRSTHFDIALTPAGLGRVDVRVEISAHGQLTAAMSFDNPNAAAELRNRAHELTRALEQAGFDLSGGLSFDVAGDRGQTGQGAAQRDDRGEAWRGRAFQAALDVAGETAEAAMGGALNLQRRSLAGVDIRI